MEAAKSSPVCFIHSEFSPARRTGRIITWAGPTQFLPAEGRGPALNAKTVSIMNGVIDGCPLFYNCSIWIYAL